MRKLTTALFLGSIFAGFGFAGTLVLEAEDPGANPEAQTRHAVVVAHTSACQSPDKTIVTATAEGLVAGQRQTIPLKVIALSKAGTYAVAHEWPREGKWIVKLVATNPQYPNYATAVTVPITGNRFSNTATKQFRHAPTPDEVNMALKETPLE